MAWSKKAKFILQLALVLLLFASNNIGHAQLDSTEGAVWNNEQWQQAKDGIEYKDNREPEKEEEEEEEETAENESKESDADEPDFNLSEFFLSPLGKTICILFIVALLAATIALILSNKGKARDAKLTKPEINVLEDLEELPAETDIERLLRLAIEASDFKTAVRILYIGALQHMNELNLRNWQKDKTTRDYLNEMRGRNSFGQFKNITLVYEVVWYGDTPITLPEFEQMQTLFDKYKSKLNDAKGK
jgi:hypothetical protein